MTELELATMDAKQVWLNAGDADGNAEAARFALEHGDGSQRAMQRAIEHLALAKEQAERTALLAAKTLARLQAMTANAIGQRGAACGASAAPTGCASNGN